MKEKIPFITVCVVLIVFFAQFLLYSATMLMYPYEWDHSEGMVLFYAKQLADGMQLYKDPSVLPMVPVIYTPLYPLVLSVFIRIFEVSLFFGRLLSLVSALCIGAVIFLAARKRTMLTGVSLIAVLLFFANNRLSWWFLMCRVDTLMLALMIAGLYILSADSISRKRLVAAVLLLTAAFYTKQTAVFGFFTAFVFFAIKDRKRIPEFLLLSAAAVLLPFILMNFLSKGAFYTNVVEYNRLGYNLRFFIKTFREFFFLQMFVFSGALIELISAVKNKRIDIWHCYFMTALLSVFFIGSPGAGTNHFIILFSAECILFVSFIVSLKTVLAEKTAAVKKEYLTFSVVLFQLCMFLLPSSNIMPKLRFPQWKRAVKVGAYLDEYISSRKGEVFMDLNVNALLKNSKEVYYFGPPYWLRLQHARKYTDMSAIEDMIKTRKFDSLVITDYFIPPLLKELIREKYVIVFKLPVDSYEGILTYNVYEPKQER